MTCENCWQRQWDFFRFAAAPAVKQSKSIVRCDLSKKKKCTSPQSHTNNDLRLIWEKAAFVLTLSYLMSFIYCSSKGSVAIQEHIKYAENLRKRVVELACFLGVFLGLFQNPEHILQYYEWFVLQIMAGLYTLSLLTFEMYVFLLSYENIIYIHIYK